MVAVSSDDSLTPPESSMKIEAKPDSTASISCHSNSYVQGKKSDVDATESSEPESKFYSQSSQSEQDETEATEVFYSVVESICKSDNTLGTSDDTISGEVVSQTGEDTVPCEVNFETGEVQIGNETVPCEVKLQTGELTVPCEVPWETGEDTGSCKVIRTAIDAMLTGHVYEALVEPSETKCDNLPAVIESRSYDYHIYSEEDVSNFCAIDCETESSNVIDINQMKKPKESYINTVLALDAQQKVKSNIETTFSSGKESSSDLESISASPTERESSEQPQILVTPAEASDCEEILEKEKLKPEITFSFTETINQCYRSEISFGPSAGIVHGNTSSVGSLHESSVNFSELEGLCSSAGETCTVSPNLSPSPRLIGTSESCDHRPATPKSPITVQEWIDSLPINPEEERESDSYDGDWREESLYEPESPQPAKERKPSKPPIAREESLLLGEEAHDSSSAPALRVVKDPCSESIPSPAVTPESKRNSPFTLSQIQRSLSKGESESSSTAIHGETPSKRSLFAETREKQTSFQSETSILSGVSHHTVSSIESLLESRQVDPVDILINLGFGSSEDDEGISRIPSRFLKPSKVPGNDINVFLRQEESIFDLVDSSEWVVPNISSQAVRRSSIKAVSPLVSNLLESVRETKQKRRQWALTQNDISSSASGESKLTPTGRFANVAKGLGKQASFTRRLTIKAAQRRDTHEGGRKSVLLPENRRFLDLQGQKSPEVPKRRLIIGSDSFSLGKNGEIIDSDEERERDSKRERKEEEVEEERNRLTHQDSINSIGSSITSIDSREEAMLEELHQLTLSVTKGKNGFTNHSRPSHPQEKKRNLMMRLSNSSSKRRSLASQGSVSSWEMEPQITEEEQSAGSPQPTIQELSQETSQEPLSRRSSVSSKRSSLSRQKQLYHSDFENESPAMKQQESSESPMASEEPTLAGLSKARTEEQPEIQEPFEAKTKESNAKESKPWGFGARNWSLESGKSMETVKHYPLRRTLALIGSSQSEQSSYDRSLSPVTEVPSPLPPCRKTRRTLSLPDPLNDPSQSMNLSNEFLQSARLKDSSQSLQSMLESLQRNVNAAMLAVIKTQIDIQNGLTRGSSEGTLLTASYGAEDKQTSMQGHPSESLNGTLPKKEEIPGHSPPPEVAEVTSKMRLSIHSVMNHLEQFMSEVSSKFSSMPDISSTVGQMLWLSHHQNELCSTLERLSSSESLTNGRSPPPYQSTFCLWSPTQPHHSCRSLPEQLNASFTPTFAPSNPSPIHSLSPFYFSPFPPCSSPYHAPLTTKGTPPNCPPNTTSPLKAKGCSKIQYSLSESSCEGSVDLGGGDSGALGEWNDGKISEILSPANPWMRTARTPDSVFGDSIMEKISRDLEETWGPKVAKITTEVSELSRKMDKNSEDVADIREKINLILHHLSPVPK